MAKKAILLTFLFLTLAVSPVFAQDASPSADTPSTDSADSVRERLLQRRENARSEASVESTQLRQQINAERQAFQLRVAQIEDTQKQAAIERIDTRLQLANESATSKFGDAIEKLDGLIDKIEIRHDSLETEGKDVTNLTTAIADARAAISSTRTLVEEQEEKAYIIEITTDAALRTSAQDVIALFRTDILALKDDILEVKDRVVDAARIAATLTGN